MIKHFILLVFLFTPLLAQLPSNIDLEADLIEYSKNSDTLVAQSRLTLQYKSFTVSSNHFIFNPTHSTVTFPSPLSLSSSSYKISADQLTYNFKSYLGNASNISFHSDRLFIDAKTMTLTPQKITLNNGQLTSCSNAQKDYYIQSETLDIYPLTGIMIAKKNRLHFKYLPFSIPFPYYIHGSKEHALIQNSSYFPEIGTNTIQGQYAIYRLSYFLNKFINGTFNIGYSENLYWLIGGSNSIAHSPQLKHGMTYHYYPSQDLFSLLYISQYSRILSPTPPSSTSFIDRVVNKFEPPENKPSLKARFILQNNKLIHDYWVKNIPQLSIGLSHLSLPPFTISSEILYSNKTESDLESYSFQSSSAHMNASISKQFTLAPNLFLTEELTSKLSTYENHKYWTQHFLVSNLSYPTFYNIKLSYLHKLTNKGRSPFIHENQYALTTNELGLTLDHTFHHLIFKLNAFYTLQTNQLRECDLSVMATFHCWGIGFTWKTQKKAFSLTASLF